MKTDDGVAVVPSDRVFGIERPLNPVRWVFRDGQKVLQQAWSVTSHQGDVTYHREEWRDVPFEHEQP